MANNQQEEIIASFSAVVFETLENQEFMDNYRRLKNNSFGLDNRSNIEKLVDQATGFNPAMSDQFENEAREFFVFVWEYIYLPLLANNGIKK